MKLSEYSDDELLEEVKHRGFKIEVPTNIYYPHNAEKIIIGGIVFELTT